MQKRNNTSYIPTIGIECHVQLNTLTKLFAPVNNDARGAAPNQQVSHICLGMPGSLPVLNEQVVVVAGKAALALNTTPQKYSRFDRKHYFYPDLPKGYQITQQAEPIIKEGYVDIVVAGEKQRVPIERAHLEEDAGKSTHPETGDYSLVDLNRAGTPLLEIVSAPAMHSAKAARAYAYELYLRMRYAAVSDADLYHGNMRFDVNVSLSKNDDLGTRTETKNLNSFRSVEKAVEYEIQRQTLLLEKGQTIQQETRGWDDAKQKTFSQRTKEQEHDYRYFPEPDVPPIELTDAFIEQLHNDFPTMPDEIRKKLGSLGIAAEHVEILIEAELDSTASYQDILLNPSLAESQIKTIANLMVNVEIPARRDSRASVAPAHSSEARHTIYTSVETLSQAGKLSSTNAKALLMDLLFSGAAPKDIPAYAQQQGYIQLSDDKALGEIVKQVIAENPAVASDIKAGEHKAIGFLVGCVMKASHGKANPARVKELLHERLTSNG